MAETTGKPVTPAAQFVQYCMYIDLSGTGTEYSMDSAGHEKTGNVGVTNNGSSVHIALIGNPDSQANIYPL